MEFGSLALIDMGQDEDKNGKIFVYQVYETDIIVVDILNQKFQLSVSDFHQQVKNPINGILSVYFLKKLGVAWSACTIEGLFILLIIPLYLI
jgi:hypothetical protein